MAQCYKCGSDVDETDRFCMECGSLNPARPPLPGAAGQPGSAQEVRPTQPTWLPGQGGPPLAPALTPATTPRSMLSPADAILCPKCGSKLPRDVRFCGDCGQPIDGSPAKLPATSYQPPQASPQPRIAAPVASVLPAPIAPPAPQPVERSAPDLARPMLPPIHASSWAAQPTPEISLPDHTWTSLGKGQPVQAAAPMFWAESSPAPMSPAPMSPAGYIPGSMPAYIPGNMPAQPQGWAGVSFSQVAAPRSAKHPRSQVIIMIVAAIVTVVSATAGVIVQFFVK